MTIIKISNHLVLLKFLQSLPTDAILKIIHSVEKDKYSNKIDFAKLAIDNVHVNNVNFLYLLPLSFVYIFTFIISIKRIVSIMVTVVEHARLCVWRYYFHKRFFKRNCHNFIINKYVESDVKIKNF